ncbi:MULTISPECIES: hypothetical protein [Rouxiella]|nr:hypothetical protein [Rouxiella silvae]
MSNKSAVIAVQIVIAFDLLAILAPWMPCCVALP